jgi:hypothetical protein
MLNITHSIDSFWSYFHGANTPSQGCSLRSGSSSTLCSIDTHNQYSKKYLVANKSSHTVKPGDFKVNKENNLHLYELEDDAVYSDDATTDDSIPPDDMRVSVQVYMEALCIDSQVFFLTQLMPTWQNLGSAIMDLQVVMFGNAHLPSKSLLEKARETLHIHPAATNHTVQCQHGVAECDAHAYELCAADTYPYPSRILPYYQCLFQELKMGYADHPYDPYIFGKCARYAALDWSAIHQCHDDADRVWSLQQQAAHATPQHTHVPWVIVNDRVIEDEVHTSLMDVICQAYQEAGGEATVCAVPENHV